MRTSADIATPVKYMSTRTFPGFTDYQFDHAQKMLFIGNGTDIIRYQIQIDASPTTGQIIGVTLAINQTGIPQKITHT